MESLRAHLLVAVPQLPDVNFYHSVVLMIQHDENGAFGVVLNRPSDVTVGEIWERISDEPCDSLDPINFGGPVEGPLLALHTQESHSEGEVIPGVYLAMQKDNLNRIVQQKEHSFRIFTGYSGWGEGQLEGELEAGGWLTTPAKSEHVFHREDDLWKKVAREIGDEILFRDVKHPHMPDDPSMN